MKLTLEIIKKFWESVEKTNYCWNWTGSLTSKKLARLRVNSHITYQPKRISLLLANRNINPHQLVLAKCKNYLCVNPDHLMTGDENRFWAKVQKLSEENGGCWVWLASQDKDMYGKFTYRKDGKVIDIRAHVYSWQLANNFEFKKGIGLCVCHTCDHPWCVNPDHLFLGESNDNVQDKIKKNRQARGEKIHCSKLNEDKVKNIRKLFHSGENTRTQLSKIYEVDYTVIGDIIKRKIWKHI